MAKRTNTELAGACGDTTVSHVVTQEEDLAEETGLLQPGLTVDNSWVWGIARGALYSLFVLLCATFGGFMGIVAATRLWRIPFDEYPVPFLYGYRGQIGGYTGLLIGLGVSLAIVFGVRANKDR
jgi:hypothetical protein